MKITDVEAIHLRLPEVNERTDSSQETLVVKVTPTPASPAWARSTSARYVAKAIIEAPLSHKICRGLANAARPGPVRDRPAVPQMYEGTLFYGREGRPSRR